MTLQASFRCVVVLAVLACSTETAPADEPKRDTDVETKLAAHLKDVYRFSQPDGSYEIFYTDVDGLKLTNPVIIEKNKDKTILRVTRAETALIRIYADGKTKICVDHAFIFASNSYVEARGQEWEID